LTHSSAQYSHDTQTVAEFTAVMRQALPYLERQILVARRFCEDGDIAEQTLQTIARGVEMPSEDNLRVPKVNLKRISKLSCWIFQNTGDGIERGEIVAGFYGLPRLYRHFYVDPCFGPKQRREYDRKFRYAQPRVTMALKRLEKRGLIQLICHGKYVKRIRLTERGKTISNELNTSENSKKINDT